MKSNVKVKLSQVSQILSEVIYKMSDECQQSKSYCLSAVGGILSQIEILVSTKLSSFHINDASISRSSINDDVCSSRSSISQSVCSFQECWNDDADVNSDDPDAGLDLEWDHNYNIIDSFYYLCYDDPDEADMIPDDRDGVDMIPNGRDEVDMIPDDHDGDIKATNEVDEDVNTTSEKRRDINQHHDVFLTNLIASIKNLAPANTYDARRSKRKRRRKMMKKVHPELVTIWRNVANIVNPATSLPATPLPPSYPCVNWKLVNKRFLTNLPSPTYLPLHGCSSNPDDYKEEFCKNDYGGMQNIGSMFDREFPFGKTLGFMTNNGAVNIPDLAFHGYVFEPNQEWILHASFPEAVKKKDQQKLWRKRTRR